MPLRCLLAVPRERVDFVATLELRALVETSGFGVLVAIVVRVERDWGSKYQL